MKLTARMPHTKTPGRRRRQGEDHVLIDTDPAPAKPVWTRDGHIRITVNGYRHVSVQGRREYELTMTPREVLTCLLAVGTGLADAVADRDNRLDLSELPEVLKQLATGLARAKPVH